MEPIESDEILGVMPRLRISRVLKEFKKQEGSYLRLEQAIGRAIGLELKDGKLVGKGGELPGSPRLVDRRKLKQICTNDPRLVLSVGELRALDAFLEPYGHSLARESLFEHPGMLRRLADTGRVTFLLGSKTDKAEPFRVNISNWDLLGLNHIQVGLLGMSQNIRIDIQEVHMNVYEKEPDAELGKDELRDLFGDSGPSLVSMASTLSNPSSEGMLAKMMGVTPFLENVEARSHAFPFYFVWPRDRSNVLPSAFHRYGEDVKREDRKAGEAVLERNAAAFRYEGGYLIDDLTLGESKGDTYALVAAQRRARGQIWLLVAGLTGPATCGAARSLNKLPTGMDEIDSSTDTNVFWNILRVPAAKVTERGRESVRIGDVEVIKSGSLAPISRARSK